jgi:hypothetical protein
MTKYELIKKTDTNGDVGYYLIKDGKYVDKSFSFKIEEVEKMLEDFINGKPTDPIIETLKTIEVDENKTN